MGRSIYMFLKHLNQLPSRKFLPSILPRAVSGPHLQLNLYKISIIVEKNKKIKTLLFSMYGDNSRPRK